VNGRGGRNDAGLGDTNLWKMAANVRKAAIHGGNLRMNIRPHVINEVQRAMNMPQVAVNGVRTGTNTCHRAIAV
jgi:hypothetical protein